jgi:hypothetical protein
LEKLPEDLPADRHMGRLTVLLALVSCLGGCGLAGSGAAATAAASEAQQAAQATQAEARVKQQIDASYQQAAEQRRAAETDGR